PGKNLALDTLGSGVAVVRTAGLAWFAVVLRILGGVSLAQVLVAAGKKMATELINPVLRFAQEVFLGLVLGGMGTCAGGLVDMAFLVASPVVVDGGVIAVVKVGVSFQIDVSREEFATVSQGHLQHVGRAGPISLPALKPRFE